MTPKEHSTNQPQRNGQDSRVTQTNPSGLEPLQGRRAKYGFGIGESLHRLNKRVASRENRGCPFGEFNRSDESVAASRYGLNVTRFICGILQSFAQTIHRLVETVIEIHKSVGRPEALFELFAGNSFTWMLKKNGEHLERLSPEGRISCPLRPQFRRSEGRSQNLQGGGFLTGSAGTRDALQTTRTDASRKCSTQLTELRHHRPKLPEFKWLSRWDKHVTPGVTTSGY